MSDLMIEEILEEDLTLVFAADQRPFEVSKNGPRLHFCLLMPLMTEDGRRISGREALFPRRGRLWWMLRPELASMDIQPGSLWTGKIERAVKPDQDDEYQVKPRSITPGVPGWIEVLEVEEPEPDLAVLCSSAGIPFERQSSSTVVVKGAEWAIGPLVASYDGERGRLTLGAVNPGEPLAYRFPASSLMGTKAYKAFLLMLSRHDPTCSPSQLRFALLQESALEGLQEEGEPIDVASDAQVIKWALGRAQYSHAQKRIFREALEALPAIWEEGEDEYPGRLERFKRLCTNADRIVSAGSEIGALVARAKPFEDLVKAQIEQIAQRRIEERVAAATAEIARQTELSQRNLEIVKAKLKNFEEEYQQRREDFDATMKQELAGKIEDLRLREQKVRETERGIEDRMQKIIAQYREHGEEISRKILTYMPILKNLGVERGSERPDRAEENVSSLVLPGFLSRNVPPGEMSEEDFLGQFQDVVERRGFTFHSDDLAAFHIAVKVGMWTVMAGPSGTGKSSLPRLYAEALGMRERYHKVAVQPDWLDDRDVLGAYNSLSRCYEPAASGLVQQLIFAELDLERGREGIYLVCLDEMNLSRVEHYFARFLSILEDPPEQRFLTILGGVLGEDGDPFSQHRRIRLGANVRFIGTVNVDETTQFFSPKVIDRCTLLTLEQPDLSLHPHASTNAEELAVTPVPLSEWSGWYRGAQEVEQVELDRLVKIDRCLREIHSGLGYRLRDRVLAYLASARGLLAPERAFDLAMAQMVLPRIRTYHPRFPQGIEELLRLIPPEDHPRSGRILEMLKDAGGGHDFFQLL